jgi:hypothetical protein
MRRVPQVPGPDPGDWQIRTCTDLDDAAEALAVFREVLRRRNVTRLLGAYIAQVRLPDARGTAWWQLAIYAGPQPGVTHERARAAVAELMVKLAARRVNAVA